MGIGSITDYSSFFQNYRVPNIPSVDIEQAQKQQEKIPASQDFPEHLTSKPSAAGDERRLPVQTKLEDISLSFNTGEDYSYIGSDSDLASLDMQKAISDMQKDQILQQYQYFVGSSFSPVMEDAALDGKVIIK